MDTASRQYNQLTIRNIDDKPYDIIYNGRFYGTIAPGETKTAPFFILVNIVKQIVDNICNKRNYSLNSAQHRALVSKDVVISEVVMEQAKPIDTGRVTASELNKRNDTGLMDIDSALATPKMANIQAAPIINPLADTGVVVETKTPFVQRAAEAATPTSSEEVVDMTDEFMPADDITIPSQMSQENTEPVVTETSNEVIPTRKDLYEYASNTLGLDINEPKTLAQWENMSINELVTEFNYGS